MKRTVTITTAPEFYKATEKTPPKVVEGAIGYLSTWGYEPGLTANSHATVFMGADGCISAEYSREPAAGHPVPNFTLFGLLSPDKQTYSFHS